MLPEQYIFLCVETKDEEVNFVEGNRFYITFHSQLQSYRQTGSLRNSSLSYGRRVTLIHIKDIITLQK